MENNNIPNSILTRLFEVMEDKVAESIGKEELPRVKRIVNLAFKLIGKDQRIELSLTLDEISLVHISWIVEIAVSQIHFYKLLGKNTDTIDDIKMSKKVVELFWISYNTDLSVVNDDSLPFYDSRVNTLSAAGGFLQMINKPLARTNPTFSLVNDIFASIFRKTSGFCRMFPLGLYSDAFVSWRTLHESECIIKLLIKGGDAIRYSYIKHITYNNAYRNQSSFTQDELDIIFAKLKGEMSAHGLKSKDMKKFIEYGWLYDYPEYDSSNQLIKLNFRDGIERLAGLLEYSKIYEGASEIAHSSSAFFYSNDNFCRDLSLAMAYRTFIRIGDLFLEYMSNYFKIHPKDKQMVLLLLDDVKAMSEKLDQDVDIKKVLIDE